MITNKVKTYVISLLNASTLSVDGEYTIFGMLIKDNTIEYAVSISHMFVEELIGTTKMNLATNENKVISCLVDMTMLRVWGTLAGISIPTHFNYKTGDLTITKNVNPNIDINLEMYAISVQQWIRLLMSDSWTHTEEQSDLSFVSPIYNDDYGHDYITYDSQIS